MEDAVADPHVVAIVDGQLGRIASGTSSASTSRGATSASSMPGTPASLAAASAPAGSLRANRASACACAIDDRV